MTLLNLDPNGEPGSDTRPRPAALRPAKLTLVTY